MRRIVVTTATLMAFAGPAFGADLGLASYGGEPPAGPVTPWTGCYVGGFAGGLGASSYKWMVRTPGGDFYGQSLGGHDLNSWIGGVQSGCDYQFAGGLMIGFAGDYGWSDASGSHPSTREFGVSYHSEIGSLASVTAGSVMRGAAFLATSKAAPPGSATITRLQRSWSALPIDPATRGRDGPSAAAANRPSPVPVGLRRSTTTTASAPRPFGSHRRSLGYAQASSILERARRSCARV